MYEIEIQLFSNLASKKIKQLEHKPSVTLVGGMLAGAYVGIGIILIMTLGTGIPIEYRKFVMGATFAIALILVVFAGGELFTGYTMYMTFGYLDKRFTLSRALYACILVWLGNLLGSIAISLMYKFGGGMLIENADSALQAIAYKKMNKSAIQLFFNAVLCNWLVCLAIWMTARMNNDTAKCIGIFWCLFAFIASGYEHSIANMTVFSLALIGPNVEGISITGAVNNLLWVTLGNSASGVLLLGGGYFYMSQPATQADIDDCENKS